jgi:4-amino-4-deoxy-L-arabinose transferase-like glycosyltransferase
MTTRAKLQERPAAETAAAPTAKRDGLIAVALVVLWAVLFLPNLRTNPNWYGDEGEWMEKSWTFIHGTPRVGPISNDFVFPYPYPPLYMMVNGALLKIFGNDIVVARALGALTALAAAGILFWIGTRLRDRTFGFLCAAVFLVYSEANVNFRWVRSHPMAGTLALASVGFLVRYAQERRLRDIALAGLLCSLATAANYFTYPLIGAVIVTAAVVSPVAPGRALLQRLGRTALAAATAGAYGALFVLWYVLAQPGGWGELMAQVGRLQSVAANEVRPTVAGEIARFAQNVWNIGFRTPARIGLQGVESWDWWLRIAWVGFLFLPLRDWRFRLWVPFWLLLLMYGVFKKLNNVPLFFYPATIFLPLMAVGFAGVMTWAGQLCVKGLKREELRWIPAGLALVLFAVPSLGGAWGHFETKIDRWTQQSVPDAEAAMRYVNEHTTADDFVIVPKQIYWLVKNAGRRSLLTFCARYEGAANDMPTPVLEPREAYWFDCRLENAKYVVMEYGVREIVLPNGQRAQVPVGIDAVYTVPVLRGVREVIEQMQRENWPVAFQQGAYIVLANPRFVK